jgi:hypothetical protein
MTDQPSSTPRQDYLRITRDFITTLQTHVREFEDHPELFNRDLLNAAYRTQASMVQQHFSVMSILYDREFPAVPVEPVEETPASKLILI